MLAAGLVAVFLLFNLTGCLTNTPAHKSEQIDQWADVPFWAPQVDGIEKRFELAKRTEPELIAFLRRMPKGADLHNHVSGAAYAEYNLQSAAEKKMHYNLRRNEFTHEALLANEIITVEELISNFDYLSGYLDSVSMRGWYPNTNSGHDHFFQAFVHFGDERSREDMLVEILRRNHYQQVQYLELMIRSVPKAINKRLVAELADFDIDDLEAAYDLLSPLADTPETAAAIKAFIDEREQYVQAQLEADSGIRITGDDPDITVRYVSQLKRYVSLPNFFVDALMAMTAMQHDERVVALNMVAAEDHPDARQNFDAQMKILDFLWQKMGHPNITLHAGELVLRESPVEPMWNRISQSIEKGHALRVGHGIAVAWEENVVALLEHMRDNHVVVEICLSSNESILGVAGKAHPFTLYRRAGVPVTISTDDEGISRSNLTMEYVKAVQRYDLDYGDMIELARNSLEYSFLPGESLFVENNYNRFRPEFAGLNKADWQPDETATRLMRANPKLERQVKLERARSAFETFLNNGFK
jgi:adenosine deaminase